jgi:hypothetical protein
MSERTSIVNISGDHEETTVQLARHLGTSRMRRKIFMTIYGRGRVPRSKWQIMDEAKIPQRGANAQQVQNELDHLSKHHLIVKKDNDGSVKDGSRYLYAKDVTVRANRERIIRLADDRRTADKVPTKRRPVLSRGSVKRLTRTALKSKKHLNVLYLVANADRSNPLRVDAEVRRVQQAIRGSVFRDNITVEYRPAADLGSLIDGLNDVRPQIVHFSGHGYRGGVVTDTGKVSQPRSKIVSFELLGKALSATDKVAEVVVLNSCESSSASKVLLPGAKVVITMRTSVTDIAASAFATRFYAAIASGQSVQSAFRQGTVAVEAVSIREADTPEIFTGKGVDLSKVVLT